jgi:hypothetical protein
MGCASSNSSSSPPDSSERLERAPQVLLEGLQLVAEKLVALARRELDLLCCQADGFGLLLGLLETGCGELPCRAPSLRCADIRHAAHLRGLLLGFLQVARSSDRESVQELVERRPVPALLVGSGARRLSGGRLGLEDRGGDRDRNHTHECEAPAGRPRPGR